MGGGLVPLAHSAPSGASAGQTYREHVTNVRSGALERAAAMLRFAAGASEGLREAVGAAATFHDLGKLDEDNQKTLRGSSKAALKWDHIDAGVAHLTRTRNWMAAWLVRAHHAPGLPARAEHFDPDGLGRRLRGRRHDDADPARHEEQIARTDVNLDTYLQAHVAAVGPSPVLPMNASHGLTMRLALSCLVDADHADTARFDTGEELPPAPEPRWQERLAALDRYVRRLGGSGNEARDRNRTTFYAACRNARVAGPMASCEGPVGIGKTTAVMAHLLQRAIDEDLRHIFIVAPYTNIITQTAERLREALVLDGENPGEVVAEHHHRADFASRSDRDLAVLWRAPIIVTTAVQLFETLAANEPSQLRKLHELPGSALFLDEAHAALPIHLWPQNWRWLRELATAWGCRFVFASGSLARFWEKEEIVGDAATVLPELLPPELASVVLTAERRRVSYCQAGRFSSVEDLGHRITAAPGPRLVILNTVQSAAIVAREMRAAGYDVLHLSTALCPRDRDAVLERVSKRLEEQSTWTDWTLVATSCIEAGVDLSFRTAFRERFSTASLIQVGGRVNRHGALDADGGGVVHDFLIDSIGGITPHPQACPAREVLKRQLRAGTFAREGITPAELVTAAMVEELRDRGGLRDALSAAEREQNYPLVAEAGRVIRADTRLVVVDPELKRLIEARMPVGYRLLLGGSVQIWCYRLRQLGLTPLPGRTDVYSWPYAYDPDFLGYMAGVLDLRDFVERGGGVF